MNWTIEIKVSNLKNIQNIDVLPQYELECKPNREENNERFNKEENDVYKEKIEILKSGEHENFKITCSKTRKKRYNRKLKSNFAF